MNTTLHIGSHRIRVASRVCFGEESEIGNALVALGHEENESRIVVCDCEEGNKSNLIPFRCGADLYRFRRVSLADRHGPDCPYRFPVATPSKTTAEPLTKPIRKTKNGPSQPGLGFSKGRLHASPMIERLEDYSSALLRHAYRFAWIYAQEDTRGDFCLPQESDFIRGSRRAIEQLEKKHPRVVGDLTAHGLVFKMGVGFLPKKVPDQWGTLARLFITALPLAVAEPLRNEIWEIPTELLRSSLLKYGTNELPMGSFFAAASRDSDGVYLSIRLIPAFSCVGVYFPVDSAAEAALAAHFSEQLRVFFRVSRLEDVTRLTDLVGVSLEISSRLRHRPDFICPSRHNKTIFVEATSYSEGPLARRHRKEVLARIAHYMEIGEGQIAVEIWQLEGPVPQLISIVHTKTELQQLREAKLVNF